MNHCPLCGARLDTPLDFQMHECPNNLKIEPGLKSIAGTKTRAFRIEINTKLEARKSEHASISGDELLVARK
jgi:hypothetical protein